ncbi:sulfurtransferase [Bordetella sp. LUAb4]|uniref:sulfurtransferase n=1 Tax=Bordetella sp. LUAb4 TaxID=2843195 RepID=UPI001E295909|nr:rhodanese-like domain-containing protein [Bordetella sp. LUAb4]
MAIFELATPDWLARNLGQDKVVVLDARPVAEYWSGHIPGARHMDPSLFAITRSDAPALARLQAVLAWTLSALGISADSRVVVAGAQNEVNAARVAWALAYAGVGHVSLLDGGVGAWTGKLETAAPAVKATAYTVVPQSAYLATAEDVLAATAKQTPAGGVRIIDARSREEFAGLRSNAGRTGRVPGARFWDTNLELAADGRFAAAAALAPAIENVVAADERAIVYCGGGGRAARSFIALQLAGHTAAAVYPASWNEWGTSEKYPVDTATA